MFPLSELLRPPSNVAWNLLLAAIPVALAFVIVSLIRGSIQAGRRPRWLLILPLLFAWLVFLPNTCYLLTEWRHYLVTITSTQVVYYAQHNRDAISDLLVMTAFYLLYTSIGLLAFFLAIWPLDQLAKQYARRIRRIGQAVFFLLCALGVYLGLINRVNSWDLVHPHRFLQILLGTANALSRPFAGGLVLGFGVMLWVLYSLFDIWMDGAAWRLQQINLPQMDEEQLMKLNAQLHEDGEG